MVLHRQVPISNHSAFFFEKYLTIDYCLLGGTLPKLRKNHFPNLNNKPRWHYGVIILKRQLFSCENGINVVITINSKFKYKTGM